MYKIIRIYTYNSIHFMGLGGIILPIRNMCNVLVGVWRSCSRSRAGHTAYTPEQVVNVQGEYGYIME